MRGCRHFQVPLGRNSLFTFAKKRRITNPPWRFFRDSADTPFHGPLGRNSLAHFYAQRKNNALRFFGTRPKFPVYFCKKKRRITNPPWRFFRDSADTPFHGPLGRNSLAHFYAQRKNNALRFFGTRPKFPVYFCKKKRRITNPPWRTIRDSNP